MQKIATLLLSLGILLSISASGHASPHNNKIIIGVVPEINLVKQMNRYTPVCAYLEKKTGIKIDVKPVGSYGRLVEKLRDGEVNAGFFGSFIYAVSHVRLGVEPLVRPKLTNGISTYSGVTFVRKDSGIRKPEQMRGKTIALVDPATTAGYLAQKDYLREHGINIDTDMKILWKGSHDEVLTAVMQREADIGGAKNIPVQRVLRENKTFTDAIQILDERPRPQVPENALAVGKAVDKASAARIKSAMLAMHNDPEGKKILAKFGAERFIETRDADYRPLYSLLKRLNVDLQHYPLQRR